MNSARRLEAAATRWSDYVGTAAADDAEVTIGHPSLYELADLDRDQWLVVAIDIEVVNGEMSAVVYAVDRSTESDDPNSFDVETVLADRGHLPVTAIRIPSTTDTQPFLDQVFRRVAIRLVARSFRDDLMVVEDNRT